MLRIFLVCFAVILLAAGAGYAQPAPGPRLPAINFQPQTSEPVACSASTKGVWYFDDSGEQETFRYCDGTNYVGGAGPAPIAYVATSCLGHGFRRPCFETVQGAITYVETTFPASSYRVVMVDPGSYTEDVVSAATAGNTYLIGTGHKNSTVISSATTTTPAFQCNYACHFKNILIAGQNMVGASVLYFPSSAYLTTIIDSTILAFGSSASGVVRAVDFRAATSGALGGPFLWAEQSLFINYCDSAHSADASVVYFNSTALEVGIWDSQLDWLPQDTCPAGATVLRNDSAQSNATYWMKNLILNCGGSSDCVRANDNDGGHMFFYDLKFNDLFGAQARRLFNFVNAGVGGAKRVKLVNTGNYYVGSFGQMASEDNVWNDVWPEGTFKVEADEAPDQLFGGAGLTGFPGWELACTNPSAVSCPSETYYYEIGGWVPREDALCDQNADACVGDVTPEARDFLIWDGDSWEPSSHAGGIFSGSDRIAAKIENEGGGIFDEASMMVIGGSASVADYELGTSGSPDTVEWILRKDVDASLKILNLGGGLSTPFQIAPGASAAGNAIKINANGAVGFSTAANNNAAARVQIDSSSQGFLPPRMSSGSRTGIASPPNGLEVYDSTENRPYFRAGGVWKAATFLSDSLCAGLGDTCDATTPATNDLLIYDGDSWESGKSGLCSLDGINDLCVDDTAPDLGDALIWDGDSWEPTTDGGGAFFTSGTERVTLKVENEGSGASEEANISIVGGTSSAADLQFGTTGSPDSFQWILKKDTDGSFKIINLGGALQTPFQIAANASTSNNAIRIGATGGVGFGTTAANNASAQVQINSTTRGFLAPRMTSAERNAISSPAQGLRIYNTSTNRINSYHSGESNWVSPRELNLRFAASTTTAISTGCYRTDVAAGQVSCTGVGAMELATRPLPSGEYYFDELNCMSSMTSSQGWDSGDNVTARIQTINASGTTAAVGSTFTISDANITAGYFTKQINTRTTLTGMGVQLNVTAVNQDTGSNAQQFFVCSLSLR